VTAQFVPGDPAKNRNTSQARHLIRYVRYHQGIREDEYDAAPMGCICGWEGVAGDWQGHRGTIGPAKERTVHGTRASYKSGCRCDLCTVANRDYQRQLRKGG
jgi:hypothetical protein